MDERVQRVAEVFDDWAGRGRAEGMERGHGPAARQAFDRLELPPDGRYLDIGCGNGYTVRWAAERMPDGEAIGIDVAAAMVERARAASSGRANARFVHGTFPGVELPADAFSGIFSMETFYYLPSLADGLAEVRRLLAPGGRFACVVDYYEENPESHGWPEELGVAMTRLSADGWRAAMGEAGLEVIEQTRLHPPLAPGEAPTWKHQIGSLLTLAGRPA